MSNQRNRGLSPVVPFTPNSPIPSHGRKRHNGDKMNAINHKASRRQTQALRQIFLFLSLCFLGLTLVYAAAPTEVEKLKGLYIRPVDKDTPDRIPGWEFKGGGSLPRGRVYHPELSFKVITRGPLAAFVISKYYPDKSYSVRDARAIPPEHVHHFSNFCDPSPQDKVVVALAYPEKDQAETRRIIRAWQVDRHTGEIQDIPTEGIVCRFPGMGEL